MEKSKSKENYLLTSLDKALKVLDYLGVRDSVSMTEICKGCNLDKTTVFKILYTLERKDYVFKTASSKYRLGVKFMNYGDQVAERQDLVEVATPYMQKLRDRCGQPVYLGTLNTIGKVVIMHKEKNDDPKGADTRIGYELDAYTNSLGKVLLAYLYPPVLNGILEQLRFRPHTHKTIQSMGILEEALITAKQDGYSEDFEEQHIGFCSASAPIFNSSKQCVAAIGIIYPAGMQEEIRKQNIKELLPIVAEISRSLGYQE